MSKRIADNTTDRILINIQDYHKKDKRDMLMKICKILGWTFVTVLMLLSLSVVIISSVLIITIKP